MQAIGAEARDEIFSLFPELEHAGDPPVSARPIVRGKQQTRLLARHRKNAKMIFQSELVA